MKQLYMYIKSEIVVLDTFYVNGQYTNKWSASFSYLHPVLLASNIYLSYLKKYARILYLESFFIIELYLYIN